MAGAVRVLRRRRRVFPLTARRAMVLLATGGLLAWVLPLGYMAFCQYALTEAWNAPLTWSARPPADRGAWIAATTVLTAALFAYTLRGPCTRPSDNA